MKKGFLMIVGLLFLITMKGQAARNSDTHKDSSFLRKINLTIGGEKIILKKDFEIKFWDNTYNDTIVLKPIVSNLIVLPANFNFNKHYNVLFCYKELTLCFCNISGINLSYQVQWEFTQDSHINNYGWIFHPSTGDGWEILKSDSLRCL